MAATDLITLAELKEHLAITGAGQDAPLQTVITEATDEIQRHLRRQIVTSGTLIEYHTMRVNGRDLMTDELRPLQWPILTVTDLREDLNWPRTYGAATILVAGTDYEVVKGPRDYLRRLAAGSVAVGWNWPSGLKAENLSYGPAPRPIKLTYTAGYVNTAVVPVRLKLYAKRLAALMWREIDRKIQGVSSQGDALGNYTRFGPAQITDDMADALRDECRLEFYETGEPT